MGQNNISEMDLEPLITKVVDDKIGQIVSNIACNAVDRFRSQLDSYIEQQFLSLLESNKYRIEAGIEDVFEQSLAAIKTEVFQKEFIEKAFKYIGADFRIVADRIDSAIEQIFKEYLTENNYGN